MYKNKYLALLAILLLVLPISFSLVYESYVDETYHYNNLTTVYGKWSSEVDANTDVYYSHIINTSLNITNAIIRSAYIHNGILTYGWITANGYNYYAPYNISDIETGLPPASTGYLEINKSVLKNTDNVEVTYYGKLGSTVQLFAPQIDLSANPISLTDSNNDGIFNGTITVDFVGDSYRIMQATETDSFSNTYNANLTAFVDNTNPTSTLEINDDNTYTTSRFVVLSMNFSDNYMVKDCKISSDNDFSNEEYVTCQHNLPFVLDNSDGVQDVYLLVRDLAGNTVIVSDTIMVDLQAPNLAITFPSAYEFVNNTISVTFTGSESANPKISIDGNSFENTDTTSSHSIDTTQLYDGTHFVQVRDTNNSGLTGYSNLITFVVDNSKPHIDFDYNKLTQNYYTNTNQIKFELSDITSGINLSKLTITANGLISTINTTTDCISNGNKGYVCEFVENNFTNNVENQYNITIYDNTNNIYKESFYIFSDITKPAITINTPTPSIKNTKTIVVNITTNEEAICEYTSFYNGLNDTFDNSLSKVTTTNHLALFYANEGQNNLFIKCVDNSGNIEITNQSFNVIAEHVQITSILPSGYVATKTPNLNIVTDRSVTCKYDVKDVSYASMSNTFTTTGATNHLEPLNLVEGLHFYYIRCSETNGLTMTSSALSIFSVDTIKPHIIFENPDTTSKSNFTKFTLYDSGIGVDNTSITITLNNGASSLNINSNCTTNGMKGYVCEYNESYVNGNVIITINSSDYLGNNDSSSFNFVYDTVAPIITNNIPDDWYNLDVRKLNITLNEESTCKFSDIEIGNVSFEYMPYWLSGNLTKIAYAKTHDGINEYHVICKDNAGNRRYELINFTTDTIIPQVAITNLPNNTIINGSYWIQYISSDAPYGLLDTCQRSIDGSTWQSIGGTPFEFDSTLYYDGVHTVQVRCNDSVQNIGYSRIATINVDNTPESIYMLDVYDNMLISGNRTIKVIGPNDLDYVEFFINNGTDIYNVTDYDSDFIFTFDSTNYPNGPVNLIVYGYDEEGYLIDQDVIIAVFDNTNPVVFVNINDDDIISQKYDLNISTSDNDIIRVEAEYFYKGIWYPLGIDYNKPFGISWYTDLFEDGTYDLKITAIDQINNIQVQTISNITLINNKPSVNIIRPFGNESIKGSYLIDFNVVHPFTTTTKISFDWGTFLNTNGNNYTIDTTSFNDGLHLIIVQSNDSFGNIAQDQVYVRFLNTPQSIYFVEPDVFKDKHSGVINLETITSSYTKRVEFKIYNSSYSLLHSDNDTTAYDGYNTNYDTTLSNNGIHILNATAYDANDNYLAHDTINVTFDNSINFTQDCDLFLVDQARLAVTGDNDLEYVTYEYLVTGSIYNTIGRSYTYPYQTYWYGNNLLSGNYTVRITGYDGENTLVDYCNVIVKKISTSLYGDKTYIKNGDDITFTYEGGGLNYNVSINTTSFDSNGTLIYLLDDGNSPDEFSGDGIYTATYTIDPNNTLPDGLYNSTAVISDGSQVYNSTYSFYLDNTIPNASITVNNDDLWVYAPSKAMSILVVLNTNFSDNYEVESCRYRNELEGFDKWESCFATKSYLLPSVSWSGANNRSVFMQVKDKAGNIVEVYDDIYVNFSDYDKALNDTTAPNAPTILMNNFTKQSYRVRWEGSVDRESFILLYNLRYCYTIGTDSNNIDETIMGADWPDYGCGNGYKLSGNGGHDEFADIDSSTLTTSFSDGTDYYFKVKVINGIGLMNSSIFGPYRIDSIAPSNTNIIESPTNIFNSSYSYVSGDSLYFKYNATDNLNLAGYYYVLDNREDTIPYDVVYNQGNVTINNVPTGKWYFHVLGVDSAGNLGNVTTINLSVDNSKPTTPTLLVKDTQSAQNITISWTESKDEESGIHQYLIELDDNISFNSIDIIRNTTNTNITINNNETKTYYIRIKAINKVNISSDWSNIGTKIVDTNPPVITYGKASGNVLNNDVAYVIKTDEEAYCYWQLPAAPCPATNDLGLWNEFRFTGGKNHGQMLNAISSNTYCIVCEDMVGNIMTPYQVNYNVVSLSSFDFSYTIENAAAYVGEGIIINLTAQESGTGVGEIQKDDVFLVLTKSGSDEDYIVDEFSLTDNGAGNYKISFHAPIMLGNVDIAIKIYNVVKLDTFSISDFNLGIDYSGNGLNSNENSYSDNDNFPYGITYAKKSGYAMGIASENSVSNVSGDSNSLGVLSSISQGGYNYLFITKSDKNIPAKIPLLKHNSFDREISPSFGSGSNNIEKDVRTKIEYDNYILTGLDNIQDGSYELVIRKIGFDEETGKPIVEITTN